jgi:hypothetical protein
MIEGPVSEYGRTDVLVNNAAVFGTPEYHPSRHQRRVDRDGSQRPWRVPVLPGRSCRLKRAGAGKTINIASGTLLSGGRISPLHHRRAASLR